MKNIKTKRVLLLATCLVAVVSVAFISGGDFKAGRAIDIFYNVLRTINLQYVDSVDNDKLIRKATEAMLAELDPYTIYLDEEDMADFRVMTTGKYGGVGSLVKPSRVGGYPTISNIYSGFPMNKAGVTPGDTIISIDGTDVKGLPVSKVTDLMKGTPGTTVEMTMKKLRGNEMITYPVKREIIRISPIEYSGFINDSIGYISLSTFSTDCSKEVKKALEELEATGNLKSLILDLRGNGGGLVSEAVNIVGLFVPKGSVVVSMRGKDGKNSKVYKTTSNPIASNLPIAVMMSSSSASASEIVAGALQDMDRGYIVGERSFGKGLVQSPESVGYGSYVKVTIAKYYTPSGRCIQALDYTHRNEDGSVKHIPDSLISEFKSVGGRTLYDGGGIMPDSVLNSDFLSIFTASVMARGYIDDYATIYYRNHNSIADVRDFKFTDREYADFAKFLEGKEIEFESKSEKMVSDLREAAAKERNLDLIKDELDIIEKRLKQRDLAKSLADNKKDLMFLLELDIIAKYYFNGGRSERLANNDPQVKEAVNILSNSKEYNYVIKHKSPRKN